MTEQRRTLSLAEQAAAWVPPWARTPSEPARAEEPSPAGQAGGGPEPAAPAEPDREPDLAPAGPADPADAAGHPGVATPGSAPDAAPPAATATPEAEPAAQPRGEPGTPGTAGEADAEAAGSAPPELSTAELRAALEAVLLVVDEPVSEKTLAEVLGQPVARVEATLVELSAEYTAEGRGFDLRRAAGGWRYYTRAEQAPYVERFVLDGQQARLTQAALETLAVVAYQQPVTRSRISAIRGVNSDGVIRTLLTRGLIEEAGTEPESGAYLYRTTSVFLEKLGLDSLDQLPPLAPFLPDDVEALDPDRKDDVEAGLGDDREAPERGRARDAGAVSPPDGAEDGEASEHDRADDVAAAGPGLREDVAAPGPGPGHDGQAPEPGREGGAVARNLDGDQTVGVHDGG